MTDKKGSKISRKKIVLFCFLSAIVFIPILMYLIWKIKPVRELNVIILDKTVLTKAADEHASFTWVLNNEKINKRTDHAAYDISDYYGFFPLEHEKYNVKDFERMDDASIAGMVNDNDVVYFTDTYGIYSNEWFKGRDVLERSNIVYGGMTDMDLSLLKKFKDKKKLIITEFNCIGSPTRKHIRREFEALFGIQWTGWIGRFFENLDEKNEELPGWLVQNYKAQHNNKWSFTKSGIAFINEDDHVEILEAGTDLEDDIPNIYTGKENAKRFGGLPEKIKYPFWFDIFKIQDQNLPVSLYHIHTTARGDSILAKYQILKSFPAVIQHYDTAYKFYYFAGDFADNPISAKYSNFAGVGAVRKIGLSADKSNREDFFWMYYRPLISTILEKYIRHSMAKQ